MINPYDYEHAIKKLFPRKNNKVKNSLFIHDIENMEIFAPFVHCSYKRSNLSTTKFSNLDLSYSAWTESKFKLVLIINSTLSGSNLQLCVFEKCNFNNNVSKNISFDHSYFKDTVFENITFYNCGFGNVVFVDCNFINCIFKSSSFNGAKFINCHFDHLVARNLNMDYSQYCSCDFYDSQISLFQCPYTIGLLQILFSRGQDNCFAFQGKNMSLGMFFNEYINYLIPYFDERKEYFPLANILCFKGKFEEAKSILNTGIRKAILDKKYKLALHYCELINFYNCFSSVEKREIIQYMNNCLMSLQETENISESIKYSVVIENSLLNNYDNREIYYISIQTDFISTESCEALQFISELDDMLVIEQGICGEHNIRVTHNSPLWLDIIIAIGASVAAGYMKDGLDYLIKKIKKLAKENNTTVNKITIKAISPTEGKIDSDKKH